MWMTRLALAGALLAGTLTALSAQTPPSDAEKTRYTGLHAAVARGHRTTIVELLTNGLKPDVRDANGRTPLHVAAHMGDAEAMALLVRGGADPNALDNQRYDIVTILAVRNDVPALKAALKLGASAKNVTSPYDGTALIAAAHLGHHAIVRALIAAGAPLDHVNNLGWTAVIESIVLGDGGANHRATLQALLEAGANPNLADRQGRTPLTLAKERGFGAMVEMIEKRGGR